MEDKLEKFRKSKAAKHNTFTVNCLLRNVWNFIKRLFNSFSVSYKNNTHKDSRELSQLTNTNHSGDSQQKIGMESKSVPMYWLVRSLMLLVWSLAVYYLYCQELAGPFILVSAAVTLFYFGTSSKSRKKTELSAYSVFNPNCVRIEGTLTAEQFENEILRRPLSDARTS